MFDAIYTGPEMGSGGGGSTNPTTGVMPVNQFGTFQDSNISSDVPSLATTFINVDDANSRVTISSEVASVELDGLTDSVRVTGVDIELYGDVNVHNHLGLPLLKFVGGTAAFPALKRNGANLEVRTANDAGFSNITANDVTAQNDVIGTRSFITVGKSILESITNGNFTLFNAAKTAFSLLQFGGVTNLFPALKRSATVLEVRLADDSGYANIRAAILVTEAAITSVNASMGFRVNNTATNIMLLNSALGLNINLAGAGNNNASAILQADSTTKGFLLPRMTAANRTAIATPAVGLMVYQTDGGAAEGIWTNKSTGWVQGV
jgi:hypothetical protein